MLLFEFEREYQPKDLIEMNMYFVYDFLLDKHLSLLVSCLLEFGGRFLYQMEDC